MPADASYSMMYGLPGGFSIVMYSGTHRLKHERNNIHLDCATEIIVPENMCIIWHEGTLHSGAKTCNDENYTLKPDLRLFSYIWRGSMGRTVRTASGESIYRKHRCVCDDVVGKTKVGYSCDRCRLVERTVLDLTVISSKSYDPGSVIIGDLEKVGWVVVRGTSKINQDLDECHPAIEEILDISQNHQDWFEIDNQKGRKMMFDHESVPAEEWSSEAISNFFKLIKKKILKRNLKHEDYIMGKFNLLRNFIPMENDQMPHYDYPPRYLR